MTGGDPAARLPRSLLYVPGTKQELFGKASVGPADAVVLDLEDAVPVAGKDDARRLVRDWLAEDDDRTAEQWVRVNAESIEDDLGAVVQPRLDGVLLAKGSAAGLTEVARQLDALEARRGVAAGRVRVVALLETAQGLLELPQMAGAPRLLTFGLGEVDLLADLRMTRSARSEAAVDGLRLRVVLQAAAAGLAPPVAPTSTDFRDLEQLRQTTLRLHDLGFRARTAIHPAQVPVIHEVFTPSPEAVAAARDVLARSRAAGGGVTTDEQGRLIDAAVVRGAAETMARAQ